jgi:hypothetical protein
MKFVRLLLFLFAGAVASAAENPVSLVLTYRAAPEHRVAFREWLAGEGAAQLAQWKREGVFADCLVLFTSFAATTGPDAVAVLDFAQFSDSQRWMTIERTRPGGLTPAALKLASVHSCFYADTLARAGASRDRTKSAYLLAVYDVAASADKYKSYVAGYIVPQMNGWLEAQALSSYRLFFNHAPLSVVWDAILLLEYQDIAALGRRDEVKAGVRVRLAETDATWLAWSKDKGGIRTEKALIVAEAIPLPQ